MLTSEETQHFLLMRHRKRWDLPKGHCEEGESFREAALRETREETGIKSGSITFDPNFQFDLVYPVTYKSWGDHVFEKKVRYFLGYLDKRPKLKLTEHESAEWLPWDPPHLIQSQTVDPLLAAVAEHLAKS